MRVAALRIGGKPDEWRQLGFEVGNDGIAILGGVRLELLESANHSVIHSWALEGAGLPASIDGLPTEADLRGGLGKAHPNGATSIDHLVVLTPSLDRTTVAFAEVGVERRRVREAGGGVRQGFFLVDDLLVEVVETADADDDAPARFWGLTAVVADIDHAASLLGDKLGAVKDAVQPGRRIATVRPEASGELPLALITPR